MTAATQATEQGQTIAKLVVVVVVAAVVAVVVVVAYSSVVMYSQHLVGGFKHFLFSIIYGIILPIDQYFSRWLKHVKTTNQVV